MTSKHIQRLFRTNSSGVTLIEMLVTLALISILASAALPYAEMTIKRNKELELRKALRTMRYAIDEFHQDWRAERISKTAGAASEDGYPVTLKILVEGVDLADAKGGRRYYLRRIPENPYAKNDVPREEQWQLRSYKDAPETTEWGGQDVFDVLAGTEAIAINGSKINEW